MSAGAWIGSLVIIVRIVATLLNLSQSRSYLLNTEVTGSAFRA
jgi:hypothetical protein